MSKIEWTQKTWNPTIGCTEVSPGCTNCYAAKMAWRLAHIPAMQMDYWGLTKKLENGRIVWTGEVRSLQNRLMETLENKKPTTYFVDSMSDLFHRDVSFEFIDKVFAIMALTPQHTYQVLTKRAGRMVEYFAAGQQALTNRWANATYDMGTVDKYDDPDVAWCAVHNNIEFKGWPLQNVWLGVSVENQKAADERIPYLNSINAAVKFLSCEPLLGPVDLNAALSNTLKHHAGGLKNCISWVIAGGESGHGARPMHPDWPKSLRNQCASAGVPFFFKQWGEFTEGWCGSMPKNSMRMVYSDGTTAGDIVERGRNAHLMSKVGKKAAGRMLDGKLHDGFPNLVEPG